MSENKIKKISLVQRKTTFKEVSLGFSKSQALVEAKRCLQCKNSPCVRACPVNIDIKEFIRRIVNKEYSGALNKIREKNNLGAVCGRVCPQEELCQRGCVLNKTKNPIKIGYLERFAADYGGRNEGRRTKDEERRMKDDKENIFCRSSFVRASETSSRPSCFGLKYKQKVAVVGSGPAGLVCAGELVKKGFSVEIFEALHKPGGVLVYGIPQFRLPKNIIDNEVSYIKSLGVKVHANFFVGKTKTITQLRGDGFSAFFIGVGAGAPLFLNIEGENLNGVYSANEFLTRINLMKAYLFPKYHTPVNVGKRVGVIGAGNVAFDCARSALRLGAKEVFIIYRRTRKEVPAREEVVENAKEEGIEFKFLTAPVQIISDGKGNVVGAVCIKNKLGFVDSSGRKSPVPIEGSEFRINLDTIVFAIGTSANPLFIQTVKGLVLTKRGYIEVDDNFQTSIPEIFAGGDIVSGSATVISAIQQGKVAAVSIEKYLKKES